MTSALARRLHGDLQKICPGTPSLWMCVSQPWSHSGSPLPLHATLLMLAWTCVSCPWSHPEALMETPEGGAFVFTAVGS